MHVIDVVAKEISVIVELSVTDIVRINTILDHMEFTYDGNNPDHCEANEYLLREFTPLIKELVKQHGITTS